MAEPEIERSAVGVHALARELPVEPVTRLQCHFLAGAYCRHRVEIRMPAVVGFGCGDSHRSAPIRSAVRVAAAISAFDHRLGVPS